MTTRTRSPQTPRSADRNPDENPVSRSTFRRRQLVAGVALAGLVTAGAAIGLPKLLGGGDAPRSDRTESNESAEKHILSQWGKVLSSYPKSSEFYMTDGYKVKQLEGEVTITLDEPTSSSNYSPNIKLRKTPFAQNATPGKNDENNIGLRVGGGSIDDDPIANATTARFNDPIEVTLPSGEKFIGGILLKPDENPQDMKFDSIQEMAEHMYWADVSEGTGMNGAHSGVSVQITERIQGVNAPVPPIQVAPGFETTSFFTYGSV
jgi:hypothetical protein